MTGLFSAVELGATEPARRTGYRLRRLEILNWGTFHDRVWCLDLDGDNALLTGDIGSGKSTLVDAVTTLLLPAQRISYNKAAGAEVRERNLRSYVEGYYKAERNEETGSSRPVGLRGPGSLSVLIGVFRNEGYDADVSLAQVFWLSDGNAGQPDRFFVTAERQLSIVEDFSDFGTTIAPLKKRLRTGGARLFDHFPEYGKDFRRRLGIDSEQAMELFHQTVSMKSVGDLNDFVRHHMLEPFDTQFWIKQLVDHFEDLTKAHDAVVQAREQLALLNPLLEDCDTYDEVVGEIDALGAEQVALPYFCAHRKAELLQRRIDELGPEIAARESDVKSKEELVSDLEKRKQQLLVDRSGHGGDRLVVLEQEITNGERVRDERRWRRDRFNDLLKQVELSPVERAEQFPSRIREIAERADAIVGEEKTAQERVIEVGGQRNDAKKESEAINAELVSLRERRSNLPSRSLELRSWLCDSLALTESELPFAGELIQVRPEWSEWEGAAERLLHSFALSLLVPETHYRAVSDWINTQHLGARLVYYRVPPTIAPGPADRLSEDALFHRLQIADTEFYPWMERELTRRAEYVCVETMEEFRRERLAISKEGQIKGAGGRHEKDDRRRIGDRSHYVLGWSNEQKIDALLEQAATQQKRLSQLSADYDRSNEHLTQIIGQRGVLGTLREFQEYDALDWESSARHIADLAEEKKQLEESSSELGRIGREIERTDERISAERKRRDELFSEKERLSGRRERDESDLERAQQKMAEPGYAEASASFERLRVRVDESTTDNPDRIDERQSEYAAQITTQLNNRNARRSQLNNRIVAKMSAFRQRFPLETEEFDASVDAVNEYRQLRQRLADDDLPRFEKQFKDYLNTNTIRDIAGFQAQLNKQADLIQERIDTINDSLSGIEYNPSRYIRLERHPTPNTDVRDFRTELRACTEGTASHDESDQYSEQKFLQVKAIIERFRGRDGQTDADRAWARRVTDVRNWFVFSASERWVEDDTEHETYTDSGGKSGGQKEKLAYTILAASLAYQFKLDWGAAKSKAFRFVVIDEAFGRGSDESTRYALELFARLGLQLLIVTPLQKIHVIEPHVSAVGFVDNTQQGDYSRLQCMTIEEYRARRTAHAILESTEST